MRLTRKGSIDSILLPLSRTNSYERLFPLITQMNPAPTGHFMTAQGNALGKHPKKSKALKGRQSFPTIQCRLT